MSFGACAMREPVTTTSCTASAGAPAAGAAAVCAYASGTAAVVAQAVRATRTACRTFRLGFLMLELPKKGSDRLPRPMPARTSFESMLLGCHAHAWHYAGRRFT